MAQLSTAAGVETTDAKWHITDGHGTNVELESAQES